MVPWRSSECVRRVVVLDLRCRSWRRAPRAAPSKVSSTLAKALISPVSCSNRHHWPVRMLKLAVYPLSDEVRKENGGGRAARGPCTAREAIRVGRASSPSELRRQPGGLPDRYDGCGGGLEGRRRVLIRPAASDSRRDDPDHAATALMLAVGIPFGSQVAPARANIRFTL